MPDPTRVERMVNLLLTHKPDDPVFYEKASESERHEMKAASASVGRVPMATERGQAWKPLLDPDVINDARLARAEATDPAAAQKVRELAEIRAMQVTITGVALSEI